MESATRNTIVQSPDGAVLYGARVAGMREGRTVSIIDGLVAPAMPLRCTHYSSESGLASSSSSAGSPNVPEQPARPIGGQRRSKEVVRHVHVGEDVVVVCASERCVSRS
jgi:hypothetical protein